MVAALEGQDPWSDTKTRPLTHARYSPLSEYAGVCKLCHSQTFCIARFTEADDLTSVPRFGRSDRDTMSTQIRTIATLAEINSEAFV